ncbi:DUF5675 family protein [Paenimyroides viscosum]|jgi:hypothetical protein|uniref:DUF5675 domain-containing protein n=1 Tax=Paenimyroides viscosum TaxID=2488729 RepID=A0A3P1AR42_9FLAO|nr:DUF5675 family protein [Paenimyroides viscosum]RRA90402.1 hypothetical protein EG242_13610 [Paenimyroides viscosum]
MLVLKRIYLATAVHGELTLNGKHIAYTIELPWQDNKRRVSCIPEGTYVLRKRYSEKFKWHFVLLDVPNRSYILLHPANNAQKELQGCIAPVTRITGEGQGIQSRKALQVLTDALEPYRKSGSIKLCITSNNSEL